MALVVKDRVQVTSTTTGTGTFTLGSAVSGFQDFSVIGNGNTTYYAIVGQGTTEWEVGLGTYTSSGTTLSRDTILESSNGGTAVNFSAGTKNVFVTYPAEKGLYLDASGNAIGLGTPASATLTNATGLPISTGVSGLGTNVATALAVNVGSSGAFVTNGGALGTPSSGTVTNLTGTASININGTVGATTANTGAFTTLSASGVATFSAGTVSAPAITTTGDTNTGIFFPAADTISFAEGGAESMRLDSSGNIGIGTTSPSTKLSIGRVDSSNEGGQIDLCRASDNASAWAIDVFGNTSTPNFRIVDNIAAQSRMAIDSSGNLQFNSGYGSVVTAYGCRAWVNFDGVNNTSVSGTYSQSGTTVTVTITNHGLIAGDIIYADITSGTGVDGRYTVATVTSSSVFTYTAGTSLTTSGNITLVRSTIRASANVSTVADLGTGEYVVNFTTAMPDANYCFSLSGGRDTGGAPRIIGQSTNTPTASSLRVKTMTDAGVDANSEYVCVAIFR